MISKIINFVACLISIALLLLCGCTSSDEKAEQAAAAARALQMEGGLPDPVEAARTEARKFLTRSWSDSLQLHSQLLEVKAMQSRYMMAGKKEDAALFDSVFISTLRTVNPTLCRDILSGMRK